MSESEIEQILNEIRRYADEYKSEVAQGRESPDIAALAVQKYGNGLAKAVEILCDQRSAVMVIYETDKLVDQIDDT